MQHPNCEEIGELGNQVRNRDLGRGNGAAGIISPNPIDDLGDTGGGIAAPEEVVAGELGVELGLARGDGREREGFGAEEVLEEG